MRSVTNEEVKKLYEEYFDEPLDTDIPPNAFIIESPNSWAVCSSFGTTVVIYWASIPKDKRGSGIAQTEFQNGLKILAEKGFKRVELVTKRKNVKPQILCLKNGFLVLAALAGSDGMQLAFAKEF
jgi:hypothetical protein